MKLLRQAALRIILHDFYGEVPDDLSESSEFGLWFNDTTGDLDRPNDMSVWEPLEDVSDDWLRDHINVQTDREMEKMILDQKNYEVINELVNVAKCALADLEGIMPEFDGSGDRVHPGWTTIDDLKKSIIHSSIVVNEVFSNVKKVPSGLSGIVRFADNAITVSAVELLADDSTKIISKDDLEKMRFESISAGLPTGVTIMSSGVFIGSVVDIKSGCVLQDTGRGKIVAHDLKGFEKSPVVGDKLFLSYKNGVLNMVGDLSQDKEKSNSR